MLLEAKAVFLFFFQIEEAQSLRNQAIQGCIKVQLDKAKQLMAQREKDPDDYKIRKQLNREQSTVRKQIIWTYLHRINSFFIYIFQLRLFQQELAVEDIVKERVQTAFHERCRNYYRTGYPS